MTVPQQANSYVVGYGTSTNDVSIPVYSSVDPASTDVNYPQGKRWINESNESEHTLASFTSSGGEITANWITLGGEEHAIATLSSDSGTAVPSSGDIDIAGGTNINTSATGATLTVNLDAAITLATSVSSPLYTTAAANDLAITSAASQDIVIKMGDAAGAQKVSFTDSADAEVALLDSDGGLTVVDFVSSGTTQTMGNSATATTVAIGGGVGGNTISLGNGANTSSQTINIANGATAANSSVNILSGNGTAGTQTFKVLDGTRAGVINLATGAAQHAVSIGSASAGSITIDTGANLSLDSATASNFTCSLAASAAALTLSASAADGGITLDAGVTPGVTFTNGTQSHQMLVGTGSPNGSVTASQGSMYVDVGGSTSTTILFVNTDGGTTWVGVGA